MSYSLVYRDKGFYAEHVGVITLEEISDANGKIHGHEFFDSHNFQIINLLSADFSEIDTAEADSPGATDSVASKTRGNVKIAFVVTDEKAISFCEEYVATTKELGSSWTFHFFQTLSNAEQWAHN